MVSVRRDFFVIKEVMKYRVKEGESVITSGINREGVITITKKYKKERRKIMKKLLTVISIMIFISYGIACADGFTNASIQGTYAMKATFGSHDGAAIGVMTSEGDGNVTGSGIQNLPGLFWQRNVMESTFDGTYTVNADGIVTFTNTFTVPGGIEVEMHADGVIMQAEYINDVKVATELFAMEREPINPLLGKAGSLATFTFKRLPD